MKVGKEKKFISPTSCIGEKFRLQKVGVVEVFFILKSGVHFSFWAHLNFSYLLRPTLSEFYRKGRRCKILIFNFFQPLLGLVSSPHSLFSVHSPQSQFHFHPAVVCVCVQRAANVLGHCNGSSECALTRQPSASANQTEHVCARAWCER